MLVCQLDIWSSVGCKFRFFFLTCLGYKFHRIVKVSIFVLRIANLSRPENQSQHGFGIVFGRLCAAMEMVNAAQPVKCIQIVAYCFVDLR